MTATTPDVPAGTPRLNAIGMVVAEMNAAVAFYRRLGLVFPSGAAGEDHTEAALGGGISLMLDTESSIREIYPGWEGTGSGRVALAVELASPGDVDSLYADLAADGFGVREPWDAFWGQRYANVRDPDGTHIDLYAALPTSASDPETGSDGSGQIG